MKIICSGFIMLLFACFQNEKNKTFIASTPAGSLVRLFLGIPLSDSVDFIQWKMMLSEHSYTLTCKYEVITRSNVNIKENKMLELKGRLSAGDIQYTLHYGNKTLELAALNANLLHILDTNYRLLVGNGGWSYTMNSNKPAASESVSTTVKETQVRDSVIFEGRTPCGVPGIILEGSECYKLKWKIVFYGNPVKNEPTTCIVYATPFRKEGGKQGTWKMLHAANGRIHYQVYDATGKPYLYLEKADENILLFTDAGGKLLTGDQDYSFTLNRRF